MGSLSPLVHLRHTHTKTTKMVNKTFTIAVIAALAASNAHFIEHEEANDILTRSRRSPFDKLNPDTWCIRYMGAPECWDEFSEEVWQPARLFGNKVDKKA